MRRLSAEARLLDVVDLHDSDRIVTFLSPEWGTKRGVAKGAKRKFSRFGGQLQLLSKAVVGWFEKDHVDLVRIESVELVEPPGELLSDLEGILIGSYMAEHLREFAQENEDSELYCRLLESTLKAMAESVPRGLALRYFEIWVLRLAGVFASPDECAHCGKPILNAGATLSGLSEGISCEECVPRGSGVLTVGAEAVAFLRQSETTPLSRLSSPAPRALEEIEQVCRRVRNSFLDHELRSYTVMKSTLQPTRRAGSR